MIGVEGLGRRALSEVASTHAQALASDLDHLGMQVTPANVLQVRNALRGEAQRLGDLLRAHDYTLTVRPGTDPVSRPAAELFNEKMALRKQYQEYVNALQRAGQALEQTARAYGHSEQDIRDSFATYVDAHQPQWSSQTQTRDALQRIPEPMRELIQPSPPCSVPKLSRGPMAWRFSAAQAIRRYSLIRPPRTRSRRIGVLSGMTHAGSWLGGR